MANKKLAYCYLLITLSAWGSLYVASKFILDEVPTFILLFFRYLISFAALSIFLRLKKTEKIKKEDYKYIFLIGFIGYFLSIAAQFLGTKFSSASMASLINSTNPIFINIFAVIFLKEKMTLKKVICIILAITGTTVILGGGTVGAGYLGIVFSFLSVLSWSFMSILVKKVTKKYEALQVTTYAIFVALLFSIPCAGYEYITTPQLNIFNLKTMGIIIYIALICTALAHLLWNKSLSILDAGKCSLFYPLQPMMSVILGCLLLGEEIDMRFIVGTVMIIVGILVSVYDKEVKKA